MESIIPVMKRFFDIVAALLLIPVALPVSLIAMLALGLEMRTNPLFAQTRIGRNSVPFVMYKLRTMYPETAQVASHEVNSSQVSRFGRIVRKVKVDELPQIWNVLIGQMSFVGPRPCLPTQEELIAFRKREGVDRLLPGITGVSQLDDIDMSEPERLAKSDARYLEGWSLGTDLSIFLRTFTGGGSGDAIGKR